MELVIGIGIFITTILIIEGGYLAFTTIRNTDVKKVKNRLRTLSAGGYADKEINIIRKRELSKVPWLNRILLSVQHIEKFDRLLEQANTKYPMGFFVLLSLLLTGAGYVGLSLITIKRLALLPVALFLGTLPYFYLLSKRKKRMQKFERQLPDALDLIARAMKAGHAFAGGLKMVAEEFDDPIGPEFDKTLDEINFGVGVSDALKNLANRVDCPDLKFFVTSVILQRETGGNLSEILENISHLIRERFKLQGRIKALSAEGRLSAIILIAIPLVVALAISFLNPDYIRTLIVDPAGRILSIFAVLMIIAGVIVMRRIIDIEI